MYNGMNAASEEAEGRGSDVIRKRRKTKKGKKSNENTPG
jgi:hypothetical protein